MAPDPWQRIKSVMGEALDLDAAGRAAYLDRICAGEPELRAEVDSLLAAHAAADDFIEAPAFRALPDDERDPNLDRTIGPYRLERLLGHGGMGAVYLAVRVDQEFERRVAVKMIRRGMDTDLLIRRFRHERQMLASLDHPHIARLFDGGTTSDGLPYFVMEYVDGRPIDRFADDERLTTPERIRLFLRVTDAVEHAHQHHIVHRDLKPGNVLVTAGGQPTLLDFGIAKLLDGDHDGAATFTALARPMTPDYASPEQMRGGAITPATDVYALGVLLYELLTGHRPYRLASRAPEAIAHAVCEQDPERPSAVVTRTETVTAASGATTLTTPASVSETRDGSPALLSRRLHGALDAIVLKALRKDPSARYPSAAALASDLRRYLDDLPVAASRGAWRYRAARLLQQRRGGVAAAALVLATVTATALAVRWLAPTDAGRAQAQPVAAVAAPGAPVRRRSAIAILRFRNLSGQPADAWLATALAEMLATELAAGGQLRVVSADTVARAEREANATPAGGAGDTLGQVRGVVGADYVVAGSFAASGPGAARALRLDVQLWPANGEPVAVAETGNEADVFTLVASTGAALRQRLGAGAGDDSAGTREAIRAATPQSIAAARLYAEGLERLRSLDAVTARDRLERASAAEPGSALILMNLAAAWTALGYDARAEAAAQRAFDASAGLGREQRLLVEGQWHEARKDWPKALTVYRTLWDFFSDNLEYGMRLAAAQTGAGRAADALATVTGLRALPAPQNQDPRLDLAEAAAAGALGDFPHELAAATQAVARARGLGSPLLLARSLVAEGRSHYNQGQLTEAERRFDEARRAFTAAGDRAGLAGALNSLGTVVDERGDTVRSEQLYREAMAASASVGDRHGQSSALNNLGILLKDHGRLTEARQVHERALAIRREIGDRNWTAVSLNNIGVVLYEQDHLKEAAAYYRQSLTLAEEIGDKRSAVRALHNLAIVQRETGDVAAAQASYEQTIVARAAINDRRGGVSARTELGTVQLLRGTLDAARATEEAAVALAREVQIPDGEAQATFVLGAIALARGDLAAARRFHETALALRQKLGQTRTVVESQVALGAVANEDGRYDEAEQLVQPVLALGHELAVMRLQAELVRAGARLGRGDLTGARQALAAARMLATGTERVLTRWALDLTQARIDLAAGQPDRARARLELLHAQMAAKGLVMAALESRLVLVSVARAAREPGAQRAAAALADEASAHGAGLIRARAAGMAAAR